MKIDTDQLLRIDRPRKVTSSGGGLTLRLPVSLVEEKGITTDMLADFFRDPVTGDTIVRFRGKED